MLHPMKAHLTLLAASLAIGMSWPAAAEFSASSASSAGSASLGSLSDSVGGSSDASSGRKTAAAGEYRILAIVPTADGRQALQLQAVADPAHSFTLTLPLAVATLQVGERIAVMDRPYGLAFARAQATEPFFVALADHWQRELDLRRVTL
jgi:hypothetical protein